MDKLQRFKAGVKAATPLQLAKIELSGQFLILIGILIGIYATFTSRTWWLLIILIGSLIVTSTGLFARLQRFKLLKDASKLLGGLNGF